MVFVKVSDGYETHKLQISPETTYDQLREQVQKLFPSLAEGVDFSLQYQDQDGDIISLSTDEELRTAHHMEAAGCSSTLVHSRPASSQLLASVWTSQSRSQTPRLPSLRSASPSPLFLSFPRVVRTSTGSCRCVLLPANRLGLHVEGNGPGDGADAEDAQ